ncbi:Predicted arabinose efflux permease, MFS family [Natronoarchaeum philippinense]|uniref:Predicted arabinose efflux permease, MFS family n=1 Tax=Natronoarchaeum philippinense TaxID=558529 RepID=A0A285NUL4_NATPI|nr:Predicted arabinose efflux permease, MFS family [Natronoarchaeum philippinense]
MLGSLCALVFLVNFARVVFAPLVEPLRSAFGLSAGVAGLVVTLTWVGSALLRLPTGYLLTRVSRQRVVLGTGVVLTGAAAFAATAQSVVALGVGALLLGLASGAYFVAANPLVSELFPSRVGRAMGIHGTASQLAAAAAPLTVGGVIAVWSWRAVFVGLAIAAALATAVFYWVARGATLPTAGTADRDLLGALRRQWPIVLAAVVIVGATGFVWNGFFNFYVTYLTETKGFSEPLARRMLTVVFAAGVPAFWLTGRLADRVPYVPLLLAILAGFVVSLLALTVVQTTVLVVAVSVVLGYVIHGLFPAVDTYLLASLPDQHRASAYAFYSASMMLVQASGSVAVGSLRDAGLGFTPLFRSLAAVLGVVFLALVVLYALDVLPSDARTV